jgi:hypothetical protein
VKVIWESVQQRNIETYDSLFLTFVHTYTRIVLEKKEIQELQKDNFFLNSFFDINIFWDLLRKTDIDPKLSMESKQHLLNLSIFYPEINERYFSLSKELITKV